MAQKTGFRGYANISMQIRCSKCGSLLELVEGSSQVKDEILQKYRSSGHHLDLAFGPESSFGSLHTLLIEPCPKCIATAIKPATDLRAALSALTGDGQP